MRRRGAGVSTHPVSNFLTSANLPCRTFRIPVALHDWFDRMWSVKGNEGEVSHSHLRSVPSDRADVDHTVSELNKGTPGQRNVSISYQRSAYWSSHLLIGMSKSAM